MHHFSSRIGLVCLTSFALWLPSWAMARGHGEDQGRDFRAPYAGYQNAWQDRGQGGRHQAEHRYHPRPNNNRPYSPAYRPAPHHPPAPRAYRHAAPYGHDGTMRMQAGIGAMEARILVRELGMESHRGRALPPGIQRQLIRGRPLPPGLAVRYAPAPLYRRLPSRPGHHWVMAGADLLLVAVATGLIVDIVRGVF